MGEPHRQRGQRRPNPQCWRRRQSTHDGNVGIEHEERLISIPTFHFMFYKCHFFNFICIDCHIDVQ